MCGSARACVPGKEAKRLAQRKKSENHGEHTRTRILTFPSIHKHAHTTPDPFVTSMSARHLRTLSPTSTADSKSQNAQLSILYFLDCFKKRFFSVFSRCDKDTKRCIINLLLAQSFTKLSEVTRITITRYKTIKSSRTVIAQMRLKPMLENEILLLENEIPQYSERSPCNTNLIMTSIFDQCRSR